MPQETVKLTIPFEALLECIRELSLKDKNHLLLMLEELVGQEEEELLQQDPAVRAEIEEAYAAYEAGDYITMDEYINEHVG